MLAAYGAGSAAELKFGQARMKDFHCALQPLRLHPADFYFLATFTFAIYVIARPSVVCRL